jgi:signal transduction histidine kinase
MSRILIFIEQSENRRLLAEWLGQYYDVVVGASIIQAGQAVPMLDDPFDLCLIDGASLDCLWEWVQARKQAEQPVFLPVLLITLSSDVKLLTRHLWKTVDELITKPIEKPELHARVEMLLRSRLLSLQLQAALEQERELKELKSRFVSVLSHEFRSPLGTIAGFAHIIEQHQLPPKQQADFLKRIQSAVSRMVALLDDVLELSKAESTYSVLNPISFQIAPFCRQLIEELKVSVGSRYIIQFICDDEYSMVRLDETLIRQILTNLLSNAIKYSEPNGTIQLRLNYQPEALVFQVQDEGIGVSPSDQERLFESFYRASNATQISGTGLGLAIVKQAVERQGGTISVASQLNVGTTFTVTLPLVR